MKTNNNIVALWPKWSYSEIVANEIIKPESEIVTELVTVENDVTNMIRNLTWNSFAASIWNLAVINKIPDSLAWIVPIHNTYWKTVNITPEAIYQLQKNITLNSIWWYSLKIEHILAWLEWTDLENLKSIHSHPQAISQCMNEWIYRIWRNIELVNEQSTTTHITNLKIWEAVICNKNAAKNANLKIIDNEFWPDENTTDFIVLSVNKEIQWLQNLTNHKAMIILSLQNKTWSLVKWLTLLSEAWVNMSSLHSQTESPWNTDFIVITDNNIDWNSISKDFKRQWWKIKIL